MYLNKEDLKSLNLVQGVQYRYLLARRKKLIFTASVKGDVYINFPIHCDIQSLIKSIYKSETENHVPCDWTVE